MGYIRLAEVELRIENREFRVKNSDLRFKNIEFNNHERHEGHEIYLKRNDMSVRA